MNQIYTKERIMLKIMNKFKTLPDYEFIELYDSKIFVKTIQKERSEKRIKIKHITCGNINDMKLCHFWKGDLCGIKACKQEKREQTNIEIYGVKNVMELDDKRKKQQKNCKIAMNTPEVKEKFYTSLQDKFYDDIKLESIEKYKLELITPKDEFFGKGKLNRYVCSDCSSDFYDKYNPYPSCPVCHPNKHKTENEIKHFICKLTGDKINTLTTRHKRNADNPREYYELDIDLPVYKLGIEFNGLYWHSEIRGKRDKNYHLNKLNFFNAKGYSLIHIFENEWEEKRMLVQSILKSKLGMTDKLYARKCIVKEVSPTDEREFLNKNHIQGYVNSSYKIGLYYQAELVALLTMGIPRFNTKYEWEILRYCNKLNTTIVGGFSKLLSHFKKIKNPKSIITYANRRYSEGKVYDKNGFTFLHDSAPNYFYTKGDKKLYSRVKFQKHKLAEQLDSFDEGKTEWENMQDNGWDRIWDCGNKVFEWKIKCQNIYN